MSSLIDPMTGDNLDTNILHMRGIFYHDLIVISFTLCYVS